MRHLLNYNLYESRTQNSYAPGDIVYIRYWENGEFVPVEILRKHGKTKYSVSFNVEESPLTGAPDEIIGHEDIIGVASSVADPATPPIIKSKRGKVVSNDMKLFNI